MRPQVHVKERHRLIYVCKPVCNSHRLDASNGGMHLCQLTCVGQVPLSKHVLSSSFRPAPTREGNLLKNGVEKLGFQDFSNLPTCASSEFYNRPHVGMSMWAGAMQTTVPILREAQEAGIVGEGLDFFLQKLGWVAAAMGVMNTFGTRASCARMRAFMLHLPGHAVHSQGAQRGRGAQKRMRHGTFRVPGSRDDGCHQGLSSLGCLNWPRARPAGRAHIEDMDQASRYRQSGAEGRHRVLCGSAIFEGGEKATNQRPRTEGEFAALGARCRGSRVKPLFKTCAPGATKLA